MPVAPVRAADAAVSHQNEQQRILQGALLGNQSHFSIKRLEFLNRKREAAMNRARALQDVPESADQPVRASQDAAAKPVVPSAEHIRALSEAAQRKPSPAPMPQGVRLRRASTLRSAYGRSGARQMHRRPLLFRRRALGRSARTGPSAAAVRPMFAQQIALTRMTWRQAVADDAAAATLKRAQRRQKMKEEAEGLHGPLDADSAHHVAAGKERKKWGAGDGSPLNLPQVGTMAVGISDETRIITPASHTDATVVISKSAARRCLLAVTCLRSVSEEQPARKQWSRGADAIQLVPVGTSVVLRPSSSSDESDSESDDEPTAVVPEAEDALASPAAENPTTAEPAPVTVRELPQRVVLMRR